MASTFTSADEGKDVVTAGGAVVGRVARVRDGAAYVRPRSGLLRGLGSWIADPWRDDGVYRLDGRSVARVTDTHVRLQETAARIRGESRERGGGSEGDVGESATDRP